MAQKSKFWIYALGHRPKNAVNNLLTTFYILLITKFGYGAAQLLEDTQYYYVGCYTERTDLPQESIFSKTPQSCIEICEHQTHKYAILSAEQCYCSDNLIAEERQDEQLCNKRCMANKSQYCGGAGVHSYYIIITARDASPNNLKVTNATENSLTITWQAVLSIKRTAPGMNAAQTLEVTNYLIKYEVMHTYSSLPFFPQHEFILQSTEQSFEITDLHPATDYNISVDAMCGELTCGSASVVGSTIVGTPSPTPRQPRILATTDETISIEIPPIKNDNGPVTRVLIIVERLDDLLSQPFDSDLLGTWQSAQKNGVPYYITGELDYQQTDQNRSRDFVVGDGKRYGAYSNPVLDNKKGHVHISLGIVSILNGNTKTLYTHSTHDQHQTSLDDFTYATFDSGRESIIALAVTCVIFGTCLVLSLMTYFYLRYKTCQSRGGLGNAHEMTMQVPIIERENNGFVVEDDLPTADNFKQQLDEIVTSLENTQRLHRNALRMNVNDIVAEGRYGEVITGKLISSSVPEVNYDCQLHVLSLDDLSSNDQAHLLKDFRNLSRLQRHEHILDFYGVSASADWFYIVFEYQAVSLKRRLIESRRAPNSAPAERISSLTEQLVLQWIYEITNAMEYLNSCKIVHKELCTHSVFVTADSKIKLSIFGPIPFASNRQKVDITRWLAPETLRHQHYSTKSDVWSFGCVAWECCTLGGTLYANIANSQQLLDAIKCGARPVQPDFVYQDLYQLLLNCWQLEPSERTTFDDIAYNVRQLMTSPKHALCFDRTPNNAIDTLPYYLPMLETLN
ncbi:putative tyrosine-protein kinase Wsck [Teleopsis dalmanni]|uniref:putative tyrosine-protein kinase Wsck n=1 Tax=Teleopsis dalmanni TaxID=139649 RepID=UPI0018CE208E|nr:putative tyrosine-protein kinase Wsck [Teleopsis dalmanni]